MCNTTQQATQSQIQIDVGSVPLLASTDNTLHGRAEFAVHCCLLGEDIWRMHFTRDWLSQMQITEYHTN